LPANPIQRCKDFIKKNIVIWAIFLFGIWFVVIRPMGHSFLLVPGDFGDARFNNYILEHFFRWISGQVNEYWTAPFFYPYQNTTAFSENLLGSAFFYTAFRWFGFSRVTSYQGWYITAFFLNYFSAYYVLSRLKFNPLAVAVGSFFFTFGLPLLAQEEHSQLVFRFCIPIACYLLWLFYLDPRLTRLAALFFCVIWQLYISIYLGIFLTLLLVVLVLVLTIKTSSNKLTLWPRKFRKAWLQSSISAHLLFPIALIVLSVFAVSLMRPYYEVYKEYGFSRNWNLVASMLPNFQSYFIADHSQLWKLVTGGMFMNIEMRHEHQLFPGLAILILGLIGVFSRFQTKKRRFAWLHFWSIIVMMLLTLNFNGFSIYWLIWHIPGINSIRAVTRIQLVLMWPMAVFIAWTISSYFQDLKTKSHLSIAIIFLTIALLLVEPVFYEHTTFSKVKSQMRLVKLANNIPDSIPEDPILFVAQEPDESYYISELDAMILSQNLGWSTINGYSGNSPHGYIRAKSCIQLPQRIISYMKHKGITEESFYLGMIKRVIPIGFSDCNPDWWQKMPVLSSN
jgi:hypothetical protein